MTIDEILNGLDLLAYEAEKQGHTQKEKILYAATAALRTGQQMRQLLKDLESFDYTRVYVKGMSGPKNWDAATKEEV